MPFRAPPPAQHPSVLVHPTSPTAFSPTLRQRGPTMEAAPTPLANVARHHATLRLPKPPPPPKPLYLTARLGQSKTVADERSVQGEEENQSRASVGRKKRGELPSWQRSSVADDAEPDVDEDEAQTDEIGPPAREDANRMSATSSTGILGVERATEADRSGSDDIPPQTPSSHSVYTIPAAAPPPREPGDLDAPPFHRNISREPSTASSTGSTGIFRTPVGTFRLERMSDLDDGRRYSTIRCRDDAGQLNIFFDPRLHNPFAPDQQDLETLSSLGRQSMPTETGVALPDSPLVSKVTETEKTTAAEESPKPPTSGNEPPIASFPPIDDSTLLPLPAQSLPALALHAFSGLTECGEPSFQAGEELRIEVEDVGGGWSLGYVAREGEAGRGLIPRAWFAYVETTSSPSQPGFAAGETMPSEESDYATRSIGRHVVVSGTEFEPTWFDPLPSPRNPASPTLGAPSTSTIPESLVSQPPNPSSVLHISKVPDIPGSFFPSLGLRSSAQFGSALLSVVGSAFFFSLPFAFGGIVVPGASILAATSAPTFKRDSIARAPRLPRPECDWKTAKRQDSKSLLLAWIEEGDEFDHDLTDVTQTWDIADGPAWQRARGAVYRVSIHDPVVVNTASERLHVSYTVSTRFEAGAENLEGEVYAVARRFSDFVALDDLLRMRFFHPLVIVAPLPTKGEFSFPSTRIDPSFFARRARLLSEWFTDLCRHPVLGESEELKGFLVIEKREDLARHLLRTMPASTGPPQPLFPARVYHPAFNLDAQDATVLASQFEQNCVRAADKQLLELDNAARNAAAAMQKQLDATAHLLSCALEAVPERLMNVHASRSEASESGQDWQGVARSFSGSSSERVRSISDIAGTLGARSSSARPAQIKDATDKLVARYRNFASDYSALLDMHRIILAKFEHLSSHEAERDAALSERSNRCETLLNITCAEMNRVIDERHADIAEAARRLLLQATEQQEESLRVTRSALSLFAAVARPSTIMQPSQDGSDEPPVTRAGRSGLCL